MHSTAFYVDPSGAVFPVSGSTFEHDDFQKRHLPNGWRGPFAHKDTADQIATQMNGERDKPLTAADISLDHLIEAGQVEVAEISDDAQHLTLHLKNHVVVVRVESIKGREE